MDKPTVEYHAFGTVTINFDPWTDGLNQSFEGPVKLRRCRLGDLEFSKRRLAELNEKSEKERQAINERLAELREQSEALPPETPVTPEARDELNSILERLADFRQNFIADWLGAVIARMGDKPAPPLEEWPIDLFTAHQDGRSMIVNEIIEHWQTRPLASGNGQRTLPANANSVN